MTVGNSVNTRALIDISDIIRFDNHVSQRKNNIALHWFWDELQ